MGRNLEGRVAVVTGGRRGIGKAISLRLASLGCELAIVDVEDASGTAEVIRGLGGTARAYRADVSSTEEVFQVVRNILEYSERIDILVNNAGIGPLVPFLETSEDIWDRVVDVNLKGLFFFSQVVARHMKAAEYGRIVNIHSNAAVLGYRDLSAYSASKAGGVALTRAMAVELGPFGITVNGVAPGSVETELAQDYLSGDRRQTEVGLTPVRRLGVPADIAALVAFLASDEASWITGETVVIDGGYSINAA
jgi:3-oxoacyl-[acyl-carrier protein] reductase